MKKNARIKFLALLLLALLLLALLRIYWISETTEKFETVDMVLAPDPPATKLMVPAGIGENVSPFFNINVLEPMNGINFADEVITGRLPQQYYEADKYSVVWDGDTLIANSSMYNLGKLPSLEFVYNESFVENVGHYTFPSSGQAFALEQYYEGAIQYAVFRILSVQIDDTITLEWRFPCRRRLHTIDCELPLE